MRKLRNISLALILALLVVVLPLRANAQETMLQPIVHNSAPVYYTGDVSDKSQYGTVDSAVDQIRKAMVERKDKVAVYFRTEETDPWNFANQMMERVFDHTGVPTEGDYLRYQLYTYGTFVEYFTEGTMNYVKLDVEMSFYTNAAQEAEMNVAVENVMKEMNLQGKSDYKKVKAIYDQICLNTSYDFAHLSDSNYKLQYTAYAALVKHTAVCQGYANLFYRLCLEAGLDARIVTGTSMGERHAWNIVKVDGKYYHVDSTWDADTGGGYYFFLRNTENFQDHEREYPYNTDEFKAAYPIAEEDYTVSSENFDVGEFSYSSVGYGLVLERYNGTATHVTIPETASGLPVVEIGSLAFYDNDTVQTVTVPASVRSIADGYLAQNVYPYVAYGAFASCDSLQTVILPENSALHFIGEWTFCESSLSSIRLPDSIRTLSLSCFENTQLTELHLPEGLTKIEQNAISIDTLKKLHLPASCNYFLEIQDLPGLEEITVAEGNPQYTSYEGALYYKDSESLSLILYPKMKQDESYRVPDNCVRVNGFSLGGKFAYLKKLYIGDAVCLNRSEDLDWISRIRCEIVPDASNAYYMAKDRMLLSKDGKTLIQVPSDITGTLIIPSGVEVIGKYAAEQGGYNKILIPETVTTIQSAAFWDSTYLREVSIPDSVTYLGNSTFQGCTNLRKVRLSANLESLETNTFYETRIQSLVLPEGMKTLQWQALACCNELKYLYIPVSLTHIGYDAMDSGAWDSHIYYGGSEAQWSQILVEERNSFLTTSTIHYNEKISLDDPSFGKEAIPEDNPFVDVAQDAYYHDAVLWAYYNGITTGKDETHFNPGGECTRAQVVSFLYREAGWPVVLNMQNPFSDVPEGKYYTDAVLWAVDKGITSGFKDGTFGPNKTCTRAQIVTFLWRAFGQPAPSSMENPFPDVDVNAYYGQAVLWAVENGITSGFKDGTFGPNKTCKRDQIVTFLYRSMVEMV